MVRYVEFKLNRTKKGSEIMAKEDSKQVGATSSGAENARIAQEKADAKPSRQRSKKTGTADGKIDRSQRSKEAALAKVQGESKALHDR